MMGRGIALLPLGSVALTLWRVTVLRLMTAHRPEWLTMLP
jgi:hypothetical protein